MKIKEFNQIFNELPRKGDIVDGRRMVENPFIGIIRKTKKKTYHAGVEILTISSIDFFSSGEVKICENWTYVFKEDSFLTFWTKK